MRRRYPMAFALGALVFLVLAIIGLARPTDPTPWLIATLVGAAAYGLAVGGRLHRPPIELPRLAAHAADLHGRPRPRQARLARRLVGDLRRRARAVRRAAPGVTGQGLALLGGGTLLVLGAGSPVDARTRRTRAASGRPTTARRAGTASRGRTGTRPRSAPRVPR